MDMLVDLIKSLRVVYFVEDSTSYPAHVYSHNLSI